MIQSPASVQCCQISTLPDCLYYMNSVSSAISPVAHHNPYINVFVIYLFMQKLFVDKIFFFMFLSISDKLRLGQLKIITVTRSSSFSESSHPYKEREIPKRKGKQFVLRKYMKSRQLIKPTQISYFIASLVFLKFSSVTHPNVLNRGTSKLRLFKHLKTYKLCRYSTFCQEFAFQQFL